MFLNLVIVDLGTIGKFNILWNASRQAEKRREIHFLGPVGVNLTVKDLLSALLLHIFKTTKAPSRFRCFVGILELVVYIAEKPR